MEPADGGGGRTDAEEEMVSGQEGGQRSPTDHGQLAQRARSHAMWCHLAGLAPFCGLLAAWLAWWVTRAEEPFVDRHGKESVNFQITMLLLLMGAVVVSHYLRAIFLPIGAFELVMVTVAAAHAYRGEDFRYPVSWRVIR